MSTAKNSTQLLELPAKASELLFEFFHLGAQLGYFFFQMFCLGIFRTHSSTYGCHILPCGLIDREPVNITRFFCSGLAGQHFDKRRLILP